jgi:hypothetical protein
MHTRHYYAEMGRFLSVDSHRGVPSKPKSLNRYAYALGNPVNYIDPDGRENCPYDACVFADDPGTDPDDDPPVDEGGGGDTIYIFPPSRPGNGGSDRGPGGGGGGGFGGPRIDQPTDGNDEGDDAAETPESPEEPDSGIDFELLLEPSLNLEDLLEYEALPPCRYIGPMTFDPWKHAATRLHDQTSMSVPNPVRKVRKFLRFYSWIDHAVNGPKRRAPRSDCRDF